MLQDLTAARLLAGPVTATQIPQVDAMQIEQALTSTVTHVAEFLRYFPVAVLNDVHQPKPRVVMAAAVVTRAAQLVTRLEQFLATLAQIKHYEQFLSNPPSVIQPPLVGSAIDANALVAMTKTLESATLRRSLQK